MGNTGQDAVGHGIQVTEGGGGGHFAGPEFLRGGGAGGLLSAVGSACRPKQFWSYRMHKHYRLAFIRRTRREKPVSSGMLTTTMLHYRTRHKYTWKQEES